MIFWIPIEPLPSRYTQQMHHWVCEGLKAKGMDYRVVSPVEMIPQEIKTGQFLDVYRTCRWKSFQMARIAELFEKKEVKAGDKFLFGDLWFPGIAAVKYMGELGGPGVEVYGWHHAGCADPTDFIQPIAKWANHCELGWLKMCDGVFLGSHYLKGLIERHWPDQYWTNLYVTGQPWDLESVRARVTHIKPLHERPKRVIFPHRNASEKCPEEFYRLARVLTGQGYDFVITSSRKSDPGFAKSPYWRVEYGLTKDQYYRILADSRVWFSAAYQENFGYALREALAFGVVPVAVDGACYPEMLHKNSRFLFSDSAQAEQKVVRYLENPVAVPECIVNEYDKSVYNALEVML